MVLLAGCSSGSSGGGGRFPTTQPEVCDHYVACVGAATPEALPATLMAYGPQGTCWTSGPSVAMTCTTACGTALETLRKTTQKAECACRDGEPGCGARTDGGPINTGDLAAPADWPPGPYGVDPLQTLAHFTAEGYLRHGSAFGPVRLAAARDAAPNCKCMVINVDAEWAPPSRSGQARMIEAAQDPDLCIVEIMWQDSARKVPTKAVLDRWMGVYKLPFPLLIWNAEIERALPPLEFVPYALHANRETMTIIAWRNPGSRVADIRKTCGL